MTQLIDQYLSRLTLGDARRQKSHLTFRGNIPKGRHGWLRLTPAYSLHVVDEILSNVGENEFVLDPFSGTATTPLASICRGIPAHSVDVNPFLVWFGNRKLSNIPTDTAEELREALDRITKSPERVRTDRWVPELHQIEKWWGPSTLASLAEIFARIGDYDECVAKDLLKIAFCRAMIGSSNASFGHQSMSFKKKNATPERQRSLFEVSEDGPDVWKLFSDAVKFVVDGIAAESPTAEGQVFLGDSRYLDQTLEPSKYTVVITSPPYPNRMSYIRELRPYMYWLGFLKSGRQAGELDWKAIGGTWGCATSNLNRWEPANGDVGYPEFERIVRQISEQHDVLGKYVHRYFDDTKLHLASLRKVVAPGCRCFYVVGNSKFYDTMLPVEEIYAAMFEDAGFQHVGFEAIRKRNSKKELFEFVVYATTPKSESLM